MIGSKYSLLVLDLMRDMLVVDIETWLEVIAVGPLLHDEDLQDGK